MAPTTAIFLDEENSYSHKWIAGVALIAIAMLRFYAPRARAQATTLLAALVLCFAAYVIQGKGWYYHQIPVRMAVTALLAFLIASPRDTTALLKIKPYLRKIAAPICLGFLAMPIVYFALVWHAQRAVRADYVRIMTNKILMHAAHGNYVTFISSDLRWAYPSVIYANVKLGSRYDIDFMAPMLYHGEQGDQGKPFPYRAANEQSEIEKRYLQRRAEDVERFHPKFIAIDTNASAQALPQGFRMSEYFDTNGWQESERLRTAKGSLRVPVLRAEKQQMTHTKPLNAKESVLWAIVLAALLVAIFNGFSSATKS